MLFCSVPVIFFIFQSWFLLIFNSILFFLNSSNQLEYIWFVSMFYFSFNFSCHYSFKLINFFTFLLSFLPIFINLDSLQILNLFPCFLLSLWFPSTFYCLFNLFLLFSEFYFPSLISSYLLSLRLIRNFYFSSFICSFEICLSLFYYSPTYSCHLYDRHESFNLFV